MSSLRLGLAAAITESALQALESGRLLTPDLVAHIESGVSMIVGTRDAALRPDSMRALGARVDGVGETLTVFLPVAVAERAISNVLDNGRLAVTFSRVSDHHTVQVKGRVVSVTIADNSQRALVERYRRALAAELELAGLPEFVVFRVNHWPCYAVQLRPESVFDQTPGPLAGALLETLCASTSDGSDPGGVVEPMRTTAVPLEHLDYACFQGLVPSVLATCDRLGEPNVTYLSQVHLVDTKHVALSCQFFNKTKQNLVEHPFSAIQLYHPLTLQAWRLQLRFVREEKRGPLFDAMAARIDVIASHTGMTGVFRLLSADVHEVLAVESIDDFLWPEAPEVVPAEPFTSAGHLGELRGLQTISARIASASELEDLLAKSLEALDELLGLSHTMVLVVDDSKRRLVALGSHGYNSGGLGAHGSGAEVDFGAGVIGTAAATRRMVRVAGIGTGLTYGRAIRGRVERLDPERKLLPQIELPGLADAQAQLALPMLVGCELVGVLAAESRNPLGFDEWDEAFLQIVANQIGARIESLSRDDEIMATTGHTPALVNAAADSESTRTRKFVFYRNDDAVFVDGEYLIRNVPGRILWKILTLDATSGQRVLSNRELRLDRSLGLPAYRDNLESRLILLRKRLQDRCPDVRLVPVKRGQFALQTDSRLELEERDSF